MGLEGLRDSYFTSLFAAPYLGRASLSWPNLRLCSGFSLEDFYMVTELSRNNLGVASFKTLISRSYLISFLITGGFLWLVACAHCLLFSVKFDLCSSM